MYRLRRRDVLTRGRRQQAGNGESGILLVAPPGSYRLAAFLHAAHELSCPVAVASTGPAALVSAATPGIYADIDDPVAAAATIVSALDNPLPTAVIATDDATVEIAARVAGRLGIDHNPLAATAYTRRKDLAREQAARCGLPVPRFAPVDLRRDPDQFAAHIGYPRIIKPVDLSASRGVIRADNPQAYRTACRRIRRLLARERTACRDHALVEEFIPGAEVAVEALLRRGQLSVLALLDKPEAMDGPYFEESYYVTPSRLAAARQAQIIECVRRSCAAFGLSEGPVHAECRVNARGVWLIELAARTIGGECARLFRYLTGDRLETLVIRNALGCLDPIADSGPATGVLMIPVPGPGVLRRVEGVVAASRVAFVEELIIDVRTGQELTPWPEGSSYPGFIFARAPGPARVEAALREAHSHLRFVLAPKLPVSVAA